MLNGMIFNQPALPTSIAGLVLWLRADQGITIATGVSQWNDLSGNGNNVTQATGSQQPTYNSSGGANNQPYLAFNFASSQSLSTSTTVATTAMTIFAVHQAATITQPYSSIIGVGFSTGMGLSIDSASNSDRFVWMEAHAFCSQGSSTATTSWEKWAATGTNGAQSLRVNGSAVSISPNNSAMTTASGSTQIGTLVSAYYYDGNIAEIVVYNSVLTLSQIQVVEQYLLNRYGI